MRLGDKFGLILLPASCPLPLHLIPPILAASLTGRRRSFRLDAQRAVRRLHPQPDYRGLEAIPPSGPFLVTTNHYTAPGFGAWWIPLAINSALPGEVHWIMTGAWVFPGKIYDAPMRILTTWLFQRVAKVYGFTNMPPVPPYSNDTEGRARAVRRILAYARRTPNPLIGLAPEGADQPNGVLGPPPAGLGRFIALLAPACEVILPVGIFEESGHLCAQFGAPYRLEVPAGLSSEQVDQRVSQVVMGAIARQLPAALRGIYG